MDDELFRLVEGRRGHFELESGHHGDLWLNLDALLLRPAAFEQYAAALARRLSAHQPDLVCGPLTGGAFLALAIGRELGIGVCYSERLVHAAGSSVRYRIPHALRPHVQGKRVAVVDDAINAGHAVRGTMAELQECAASCVAIGALIILTSSPESFSMNCTLPLETIASMSSRLWPPAECPLCRAGTPLGKLVVGDFAI